MGEALCCDPTVSASLSVHQSFLPSEKGLEVRGGLTSPGHPSVCPASPPPAPGGPRPLPVTALGPPAGSLENRTARCVWICLLVW